MNPFDLKVALLAKHKQHPVINGAEILLVIRLSNARTLHLILKDFWNKNAPDW